MLVCYGGLLSAAAMRLAKAESAFDSGEAEELAALFDSLLFAAMSEKIALPQEERVHLPTMDTVLYAKL